MYEKKHIRMKDEMNDMNEKIKKNGEKMKNDKKE